MIFKIGAEGFGSVKELCSALADLGYPHTVYVTTEQFTGLVDLIPASRVLADAEGVFIMVGASRIRSHRGQPLDTIDNPKWRKA